MYRRARRSLRFVSMATELELPLATRAGTRTALGGLVRAMRPRQWIKNGVVLAAPIFALKFDPVSAAHALAAVGVFCAAASAVYLVNDVVDAPADRRHPVKFRRPVAAGTVSVPLALGAAAVLLAASLAGALLVGRLLGVAVVAYLAVQVGYNLGLKRQPIIDVMCIAAGFVIRAIGGAVAVGVPVSGWFLLCVALLAFYLGIEKRKAELRSVETGGATRAVLRVYTLPLLLRMESVATGSAVMSYALWAIERGRSPWMLATITFVAFALFRYQLISDQGEGEAPERALLGSPHLLVAVALWVVSCVVILLLTQPGPALHL